ncbi:MAG: hypothetical protein H0X62_05840 [Bacteroidetes bacterium]|nr:hypothetical protein [Bacteroidota bacterium]
MKKLLFIFTIPVITIVSGCSKDQKVIRHLDGEWKVTALTYAGMNADKESYEGQIYKFEKCKVSKGNCNGAKTFTDPSKGSSFTVPFSYNISGYGRKIMINYNFLGFSTEAVSGEVVEHSKSKFIYSYEQEIEDAPNMPSGKFKIIVKETLEKI